MACSPFWFTVSAVVSVACVAVMIIVYEVMNETPTATTTTTTTVRPLNWEPSKYHNSMCRVQNCGQTGPNHVGARIIGGRNAIVDEFPYQVVFSSKARKNFCCGSMINDRWIISAAHCFFNARTKMLKNPRDIRVSVGIRDVKEIPFNEIEVEKFMVHPLFRYRYSHDHDIALIKAKRSIKAISKNFVSPICLPFGDLDEYATFVNVSGFGTTEMSGKTSSKLKMTTLQIAYDDLCEKKYKNDYNANSMICAGAPNLSGGQDACQGDSGGPLAIRNKNGVHVLKGITSYGRGCGLVDFPGVYTKVSYYLQWTCETMIENGLNY